MSNVEVLTSKFNIRNSVFDINLLNLIALPRPCPDGKEPNVSQIAYFRATTVLAIENIFI